MLSRDNLSRGEYFHVVMWKRGKGTREPAIYCKEGNGITSYKIITNVS